MSTDDYATLKIGDKVFWHFDHYTVAIVSRENRTLMLKRTDLLGAVQVSGWLKYQDVKKVLR